MPHTLLLADDSVTIQRVIELTFADEDISVVAFSDGEHAIASLDRTPPDIVLADIGMPGRSGYDVARHIKETPSLSHIPVLLLTGAFEPVDHARAEAVGCDGVLTKPFEPHLVISRVKELLAKSAGETAGPAISDAGPKLDKAAEVESYFEQLDQAFATLSSTPSPGPQLVPEPLPDVPIAPPAAAPRPVAIAPVSPIGGAGSPPTVPPAEGPGLADAFSMLLTAEHAGESSATVLSLFAPPPPIELPFSKEEIADEVASQVLAKLRDGMLRDAASDVLSATAEQAVRQAITEVVTPIAERVVRAAIVDIVSASAERMIREEIERIKSNIK